MPYKRIVVVTTYHFGTGDFWYIQKALVLKHSLDIFPSVPHFLYSSFSGKLVLFLQFLQTEPHSTNASGVGAFISQFRPENVPELTQLKKDIGFAYENLVERWQVWLGKC